MIYFCPSTLSRKKIHITLIIILSNYILLRNCFFRLYPSQELSFQTISFSGIVFSDYTLFRNCLFRLYHSHELSVQTISFSGIVFSDYIIRMNRFFQSFPFQDIMQKKSNKKSRSFCHTTKILRSNFRIQRICAICLIASKGSNTCMRTCRCAILVGIGRNSKSSRHTFCCG